MGGFGQGGFGEGGFGGGPNGYYGPFSQPIPYYLKLVASQYQLAAPNMLAWLTANLQLFQDVTACLAQMLTAFNLMTAVGAQLDVLGVILGQSRNVAFQPTGIQTATVDAPGSGYIVGDQVIIVQSGGSGGIAQITSVGTAGSVTGLNIIASGIGYSIATGLTTTGGTGSALTVNVTQLLSPVLGDADYRTLLRAVVIRNHWDGQITSLQSLWQGLFPGGSIAIDDGQNMAATVILSGSFSPIMVNLIVNGYIVPRPQGVAYTFSFPMLPILGFDENTPSVAGFDLGHFL